MATYTYKAIDPTGLPFQGEVEATSDSEAVALLRAKGCGGVDILGVAMPDASAAHLQPAARTYLSERTIRLEIPGAKMESWERGADEGAADAERTVAIPPLPAAEVSPRKARGLLQSIRECCIYPVYSGVVLRELAPYFRQLATLIDAGLPLGQALEALARNTSNRALRRAAEEGRLGAETGRPFSLVMEARPWIFSRMQTEMVRMAEKGGMLEDTLKRIADYIDQELEIRRMIRSATFKYKLQFFLSILIIGRTGFSGGLPAISLLFLGANGTAPYTAGHYYHDTFGMAGAVALPLLAAWVLYRLLMANVPAVRTAVDGLKFYAPVVGPTVRMFAAARFGRTLAALYDGGYPFASALRMAGDSSGNAIIGNAAQRSAQDVERGGLASDALARTPWFPGIAVSMFRTGETTGNLNATLTKMSEYFEAEAKLKSKQMATALGVLVFILVAAMVSQIVIHTYTGMAGGYDSLMKE